MKVKLTTDELFQRIGETLAGADGAWIAEIANKVVSGVVTYDEENDEYEVEEA